MAGTIYGSAHDGGDSNYFFQVTPNGAGGAASHLGEVFVNSSNTNKYEQPFTAMVGVKGQLKATSVSEGGSFNYYSDITPRAGGGASSLNNGDVTDFEGGVPLDLPVSAMATQGDQLLGSSWSASFNYFYEISEQLDGTGAFGDDYGGVTLGEGGAFFGYEIDTMAEYGGQLYGTAFDGVESLFFRINRDSDGAGAWIDALGALNIGPDGLPDPDRIDAMVGTDDGLYATSWSDKGFNCLFRIAPEASGIGGYETEIGALTLDGVKVPYRVNALGYLPSTIGTDIPSAVPEPSTWAMMIVGFGMLGTAARRRRTAPLGRLSNA